MFSKCKLALVATSSVYLMGCVSPLSVEESAPNVNIDPSVESVSIAVLDKRPYVVDGDKTPDFEGIIRSGLGIPYSHSTITKEPLATYLGNRIEYGIAKKGIDVERHTTDTSTQFSELISKLESDSKPSVVFVLNEWKYDFHAFSDSSWYDVDVTVIDRTGSNTLTKHYAGEDDIPSSDAIMNEMMRLYQARFEMILSDQELRNVIEK
ncbi:hypothetical protein [Vibrio agarivorans]|uniref:hypothetical protein n=1 Tax=Vibrio agarivorans TaxID=153622 RepID=UPI00222F10DC|nr:hypothetical protein [Vibrio agarivorans]